MKKKIIEAFYSALYLLDKCIKNKTIRKGSFVTLSRRPHSLTKVEYNSLRNHKMKIKEINGSHIEIDLPRWISIEDQRQVVYESDGNQILCTMIENVTKVL